MSQIDSDTETDEENVFYFESDHLALRGNRDYSNLLRTIAVLESQRVQVHQQLEELILAKKRFSEEPELLLQKIRNNEPIIAPNYMSIATIPEIGHYDSMPVEDIKVKQEPDMPSVRGRIFDESKPETFNRLWTCEEQTRLEQLLIEYPVEAIESRRFAKIAKALGNRTLQQVASRVQKYFKKLHDAGMPIPGRIPKKARGVSNKSKALYKPTTFFPSLNVPVHMMDDDFLMSDLRSNLNSPTADSSSLDAEFDNLEAQNKPHEQQHCLEMLRVIRNEKQNAQEGYNPDPLAPKCEICENATVTQTRWRCNTCYCLLNQCGDCLISQMISHKFEHATHDVVIDGNES